MIAYHNFLVNLKTMNCTNEFVSSSAIRPLRDMPFFQQRLTRFLFQNHRIEEVDVGSLKIHMAFPPFQAPSPNKHVVFIGAYKQIPLLYEAVKWDDPRAGNFVGMGTLPAAKKKRGGKN